MQIREICVYICTTAEVEKLVNLRVSEARAERLVGSSPIFGTILKINSLIHKNVIIFFLDKKNEVHKKILKIKKLQTDRQFAAFFRQFFSFFDNLCGKFNVPLSNLG